MAERHGDRPDTPTNEPAPTITSKARSDVWVVDRRTRSKAPGWRNGGGMEPTVPVTMDRPSPTLTGKAGTQWLFRSGQSVAGEGRAERDLSEPAFTVTSRSDLCSFWPADMPATTVCGDPRITARCHHDEGSQGANAKTTDQVRDGDYEGTEPIRLTIRDALILQTFDPDYPVQGTRSKQFEQIGNAVPPLLAEAIVRAVA